MTQINYNSSIIKRVHNYSLSAQYVPSTIKLWTIDIYYLLKCFHNEWSKYYFSWIQTHHTHPLLTLYNLFNYYYAVTFWGLKNMGATKWLPFLSPRWTRPCVRNMMSVYAYRCDISCSSKADDAQYQKKNSHLELK